MNKLSVKLENCYGIKKLEHAFDFSSFRTFVVYAPNGVMKTSFANSFDDYVKGISSKDKVFGRTPYTRDISNESGQHIDPKNIFVIKSFIDTNYLSDKLDALLASEELRKKYTEALSALEAEKNEVVKILKTNTKSSDCETEILRTFAGSGKNFFEIIERTLPQLKKGSHREYKFRYNDVFDNDVVQKFVEKNQENLQIYHDKYFEILQRSDDFFSPDGTFGTAQAIGLAEAVSDDAFFKTGHRMSLKSGKVIASSGDLKTLIDEQVEKVLQDPEARERFNKIDKALRPKNIQGLRKIVDDDKTLLPLLADYSSFRERFWESHMFKIIQEVEELNNLYQLKKAEIQTIISDAGKEGAQWKTTIEIFKQRFIDLPFEMQIKNVEDAALGLSKPIIVFKFLDHDTGQECDIDKDLLAEGVLSQGERRAFYLLNTIFEIRARLLQRQETLFIFDDVADSFDYKNKYAIVEYLKDISQEPNFFSVILTHNFDFFRTVHSRILFGGNRNTNALIAEKVSGEIRLVEAGGKNVTDPFPTWKSGVGSSEKYLLASIPFVRNLIDFKGRPGDGYKWLTHILHIKKQDGAVKATADIEIADVEQYFTNILGINFSFADSQKKITQIIAEQVIAIMASQNQDSILLEDKVILAIAIRLIAEEYMWSKITNQNPISGSQTGVLFGRYKKEFNADPVHAGAIKTLERVNVMTPENIHLNSFMYEPILDMGIEELKRLHSEVSKLI